MDVKCLYCMGFWLFVLLVTGFALIGVFRSRDTLKTGKLLEALAALKVAIIGILCAYLAIVVAFSAHLINLSKPVEIAGIAFEYDLESKRPFVGKGKLILKMFTDFECPWCKKLHHPVVEAIRDYRDKVQLQRYDFPLDKNCNPLLKRNFHHNACQAALFARCAGEHGKYWQVHDKLYSLQKVLKKNIYSKIARQLNLPGEVKKCLERKELMGDLEKDIQLGFDLKLTGTPAFFIFAEPFKVFEKKFIDGYLSSFPRLREEDFARIVDKKAIENIVFIDSRKGGVSPWERKKVTWLVFEAKNFPTELAKKASSVDLLVVGNDAGEIDNVFNKILSDYPKSSVMKFILPVSSWWDKYFANK